MADFTVKQGDSAITFSDSLTYSDGSVVNLTGASVSFVMRAITSASVAFNTSASITSASIGTVAYRPTASDTATAGTYAANWKVSFSGGLVETFPTIGYLTVEIEENLTTSGGATIVSLGDLRDYLNFATLDRTKDAELLRFIDGVRPVVENICGPVIQTSYDEWYDGGQMWIHLRHRPVVSITSAYEFRGNTQYTLTVASIPSEGSTYSVMLDPAGRLVRRTAGGGATSFPPGPQSVHVTYVAGRTTVPENIRLGTLELIRLNYQQTQQAGRGRLGGDFAIDESEGTTIYGFFVPNRVRELLAPSRRHPSLA